MKTLLYQMVIVGVASTALLVGGGVRAVAQVVDSGYNSPDSYIGYAANNNLLISDASEVSNIFSLSGAAALTTLDTYLWSDAAPLVVDWSFGSTPFGSDVASGAASYGTTLSYGTEIFLNSADLLPITITLTGNPDLAASTPYWLTLDVVLADNENNHFAPHANWWDDTTDPIPLTYSLSNAPSIQNAEAFEIFGDLDQSPGTPEPGSLPLAVGFSIAGAGFIHRRRKSVSTTQPMRLRDCEVN